jgi:DNA polymerase-3 subunit alpha
MASVWDCFKASKKTGVGFIPGCEFYFTNDIKNREDKLRQLVLLAKNAKGYKNLLLLHREGFDHFTIQSKRITSIIDWNLLEKYSEGLICLTACGNGITGALINGKKFDEAEDTFERLKKVFGESLGAEVQAHNSVSNPTAYRVGIDQIFTNTHTIRLANKLGIKVVATCNTHYLYKEEAKTHDIELAIGSGQPVFSGSRMKFNSSDLFLKNGDDVRAFFARNNGQEFAEEIRKNISINNLELRVIKKLENQDKIDFLINLVLSNAIPRLRSFGRSALISSILL